jgi:Concanavalin A-like lectin/glucanases superfamily/Secretion system C-terminal sorting domain
LAAIKKNITMKNKKPKLILILSLFIVSFSYSQIQLDSGLIVHYPFNGNALDSSGNGYDATLIGPTLTTGPQNQPNSAYNFDGVDDFIYRDSIIDIADQSAISISACFFVDTIETLNNHSGINFGKKTTGQISLRIRTNDFKRFQAVIGDPFEINRTEVTSSQLNYGQWYHLVGVFQDQNVQLWLNGVDQGNFTSWGDGAKFSELVDPDSLRIGLSFVDSDIDRFFDGKIDNVRIYNRVLNGEEINELYKEKDIGVGINDELNISKIQIYPNPTKDNLIVQSYDQNIKRIKIYNTLGQSLIDQKISNSISIVDLSRLDPGLYFAIVLFQNSTITQSIVKID